MCAYSVAGSCYPFKLLLPLPVNSICQTAFQQGGRPEKSERCLCRVHVGDTANLVTSVALDSKRILTAPLIINSQVSLLLP